MAINIYTVQRDLEEHQWTLISKEYKNLKTSLTAICPKGHEVEITYGDWRNKYICPQCDKAVAARSIKNKLPPKPAGTFRVLGLDAATNTTGYSLFDDKVLVAYGTFSTDQTLGTTERINQVKHWLESLREGCEPDAIGIENIQYQQFSGVKTFQTLANLQGVLADFCFENNIPCEFAYPSTWRSYLGICHGDRREEAKKQAQEKVKTLYGFATTQDEADAICIGKYFTSRFRPTKTNITWGESIL